MAVVAIMAGKAKVEGLLVDNGFSVIRTGARFSWDNLD